jgi:hypothetical protein
VLSCRLSGKSSPTSPTSVEVGALFATGGGAVCPVASIVLSRATSLLSTTPDRAAALNLADPGPVPGGGPPWLAGGV